ncbi:hypothetical protein CCZ27_08695 [Thauera sinica]|nr:hypothetical protein CCZ27_08695 [Thauera sp. K11]
MARRVVQRAVGVAGELRFLSRPVAAVVDLQDLDALLLGELQAAGGGDGVEVGVLLPDVGLVGGTGETGELEGPPVAGSAVEPTAGEMLPGQSMRKPFRKRP